MKLEEIKDGDKITFSMIRPGIYGDSYSDMIVEVASAPFLVARGHDNELAVKHTNFFPFFKDKVNNIDDPSYYKYMILRKSVISNELIVIGLPWIAETSLKLSSTKGYILTMPNFEEHKKSALLTFLNNAEIAYTLTEIEQ